MGGCDQFFRSSVFAIFGLTSVATIGVVERSATAQSVPDQMLYVNPSLGLDTAPGTEQSPLKTVTQALNLARPNTVIMLAPGTYSANTGEVFPLQLKSGVIIRGDSRTRGQSVVIQGGDVFLSRSFARQNVTIVGANRASVIGVTITNPNPQGYGLWAESTSPIVLDSTFTGSGHDGVSIVGNSAPILRNNYFVGNGANGVTVYGSASPQIQENIFERTGFGINVAQNARPNIVGNRITQNKDGIVVQGYAQPILRNNVIDSNDRDGVVVIAGSRPNLGTASDPGNNTFLSNRQFDINAQKSTQTLPAFGNDLSARTIGRLDLSGNSITTVASGADAPQVPSVNSLRLTPTRYSDRPNLAGLPRPIQPALRSALTASAPLPLSRNAPLQLNVASRSTGTIAERGASIEIPVPAPEAASAFSFAPQLPVRVTPRSTLQSEFSNVPVRPVRNFAPVRSARSTFPTRSTSNLGLLPVPSVAPPIGNVRGTSLKIWRGDGVATQSRQIDGVGTQARQISEYRFRVIVNAVSEIEQAQLKSIIPAAFWTSVGGRRVMQAGAFRNRAEAIALLQNLANQGVQASIVQL